MGLLTDRIKNKLEKSNLINEHALNREPTLPNSIWNARTRFNGSLRTPERSVPPKRLGPLGMGRDGTGRDEYDSQSHPLPFPRKKAFGSHT